MPDGAIDADYDDARLDAEEELTRNLDAIEAPIHAEIGEDDVVIDLITRQTLRVRGRVADTVADYYAENDFDLLTYKQHAFMPVRIDDPVYECVFVGGIDDLHSEGKTYDYPAGRLARVPVELAGGEEA